MLKTIHNVETGEITTREMTDEEIAQRQEVANEQNRRKAEAQAKEAARQAVLTKLGLTAEEAQALLG
jgi:poly(A) polymerase Pap1